MELGMFPDKSPKPSSGGTRASRNSVKTKRNDSVRVGIWDSLRGDPRFEQIVASLAPKDAASPTK
jgi:hypothetical protein